jgi:hypothetical protein
MHIDSSRGVLHITYSQAHCGTPAACMEILYQHASGEREFGQVEQIDDDGHHMVFRLTDSGSRFDTHLFRSDNATMVGTTKWRGNPQGFYAVKGGRSAVTAGEPERLVQVNGSILLRYPDGRRQTSQAVSGPPRPSSGEVRSIEEVQRGQENVQPLTIPDPPPGSDMEVWLKGVNTNLMKTIFGLLGNDGTSVQYYLQGEAAQIRSESGRAYYRTDFIRRWWGF